VARPSDIRHLQALDRLPQGSAKCRRMDRAVTAGLRARPIERECHKPMGGFIPARRGYHGCLGG
jgi:hypothetical protein